MSTPIMSADDKKIELQVLATARMRKIRNYGLIALILLSYPLYQLAKASGLSGVTLIFNEYTMVLAMMIIVYLLFTLISPLWKKWRGKEITPVKKEGDEIGEDMERKPTEEERKPVKDAAAKPMSQNKSMIIRYVIFVAFHLILSFAVWCFLDIYVYAALDREGFWYSSFQLLTIILLTASIWNSFDASSIPLKHAAEILYLGKPYFSNALNGFTCLGLPKWAGSSLEVVDFRQRQITFGLMKDGKREPFIIEGPEYRAIVDLAFSVQPNNTRKYLNLLGDQGDIEKQLVTRMNEVVYRFINMKNYKVLTHNPSGNDKPLKPLTPLTKEEEEKKKEEEKKDRFPDVDSLKKATAQLSFEILYEMEDEKHNKGETAQVLLNQLGFVLLSVDLKDVENEDKGIITAQQELVARKLQEKAEFENAKSTKKKVKHLYNELNMLGKPTELKGDQMISMAECIRIIERQEGGRQTIDGGRGVFVDARGGNKNS